MSATPNVKIELTQNLKSLHLPTIRQCYEEVARQAEREALSYEHYLHELVQRECEAQQENRTAKMLRESQLPLEKSLEAFDTRRLPPKASRRCAHCSTAVFWIGPKALSCLGNQLTRVNLENLRFRDFSRAHGAVHYVPIDRGLAMNLRSGRSSMGSVANSARVD